MHEFMLNIDNKEILNEILNHSVDYMIGSYTKSSILIKSHKYGFSNPEDFETTIKTIANAYKLYCLNVITEIELLSNFSHMNQDLQQSILNVVKARKSEITAFFLRKYNSNENQLLESFDWDIRFIMGDSNLISHRTQVANLIFNCLQSNDKKSTIHIEVDKSKLDNIIRILEECNKALEAKNLIENNKISEKNTESASSNHV